MKINHPLWPGSLLQLKSTWQSELQMMREVRVWLERTECLPDLTNSEASLCAALREWLEQKNTEFESD
jgi:hypothetical protein